MLQAASILRPHSPRWPGPARFVEPVALALIAHEGRLVLIRRSKAPLAGYWAPPAGHLEAGESAREASVREAWEESGLAIALDEDLGVYAHPGLALTIHAFRAHSLAGCPRAGDDAGEIALFAPGELPLDPPPRGGTATDLWVYAVIQGLTAAWRAGQRPGLRHGH